ncbi:hypothetical protein CRG98_042069 [Punica granatum]|nr:hypothetical protein CRG98_042069 [Punica granatum]
MVVAWLSNSVDQELQPSVACIQNAKTLWDDLKERFSQGNETRVYELKSQICLTKQEGLFVSKYYSVLKGLWDELENFLELTQCTCETATSGASQREKEKSYQFLMGLNPELNTVRSNILSMEPFPSLNKIYSMVIHEERQKIVSCVNKPRADAAAFYVKEERAHSEIRSSGRLFCDHCQQVGHVLNTCWKLHGKPVNWVAKGKGKQLGF